MTHRLIFGLSVCFVLLFYGCGTSSPVVATVGDEKITLPYFEDNYAKNNGGWDTSAVSTIEDRERFLDLLVKFKLKVKEARSQGLEKDSAVINEMDTYNTSVAQSYMIEKEVIDPGIQQLYNRKKEEVRASHILFRLRPNPTPDDTLVAYTQAMNIIAQLPGVPFDTLAYKFSEDPSAKSNYGDLGYFSGGKMVPEFEDACYSLKPGEYTKTPVRSQFGYHIVKVINHRPNPGSVRISHILLRFGEGAADSATVRDTVWMIYHKLKSGANFTEMVQKYSMDPGKGSNNGDLGFYESDRIPPKIAEVFYTLKVDSIAEPMKFNYGYHIFKLTERKPLPPFETMEKDLKDPYQKVRYDFEYNQYARGLKAKYHVRIDSAVVRKLIASVDTTKIAGMYGWRDTLTATMLGAAIIQSTGRPFTVSHFVDRVVESNDYKNYVMSPENFWLIINKFVDAVAVEEHARHAPEKYPILSKLLKEYEEGILLYRVEQDEVWKKVAVNDSLLREYYTAHKEEYRWPERVNFAEIYTIADSSAKAAYWKLRYGEDFQDVAQEYTNRSGYKEKKGVWGFQPYAANELATKAATMAIDSVTEPFQYQSGWSILKTLAKDSARIKSFEEATPEVASGYQEMATKKREQEWIESLKKKYPVSMDKVLLKEAFKRKRLENQ